MERFHAVIDTDELRPLLRSEIEPLLLDVAHKHYKGAKISDELDRRLAEALAPHGGERFARRSAKGPAEQGWGPDGSAGGAGRHAPS